MEEELLSIQLTQPEVNVILQFIDKSPVTGTQGMRVILGLDAKIRRAVEAQIKGIQTDNKKTATKKDPPAE